ncbi:MAG: hypothetical protein Q9188_005087 [Gyalolechia gomerana]
MPSHLHPRSRTTSSLFGLTLLASFLVVGMPHIIPCPVPTAQFADFEITEDGKRRRRRRPLVNTTDGEAIPGLHQKEAVQEVVMTQEEQNALRSKAHECPVPKPSGRIGELLGFTRREEDTWKQPEVKVEPRGSSGGSN